ncbi:MAG: hypothetical protein ISR72_07515 [Methylobacter sp.]|nr:hypothetical protein [Methylobacter sp.]
MKIQVLRSAMEDLAAGRRFYGRQEIDLGDYFFDSLFAEIALVPNLQIGNLEGEALASRNGKLELPTPNSQAGAWELAKP